MIRARIGAATVAMLMATAFAVTSAGIANADDCGGFGPGILGSDNCGPPANKHGRRPRFGLQLLAAWRGLGRLGRGRRQHTNRARCALVQVRRYNKGVGG